jgi:hypothetical protein
MPVFPGGEAKGTGHFTTFTTIPPHPGRAGLAGESGVHVKTHPVPRYFPKALYLRNSPSFVNHARFRVRERNDRTSSKNVPSRASSRGMGNDDDSISIPIAPRRIRDRPWVRGGRAFDSNVRRFVNEDEDWNGHLLLCITVLPISRMSLFIPTSLQTTVSKLTVRGECSIPVKTISTQ